MATAQPEYLQIKEVQMAKKSLEDLKGELRGLKFRESQQTRALRERSLSGGGSVTAADKLARLRTRIRRLNRQIQGVEAYKPRGGATKEPRKRVKKKADVSTPEKREAWWREATKPSPSAKRLRKAKARAARISARGRR